MSVLIRLASYTGMALLHRAASKHSVGLSPALQQCILYNPFHYFTIISTFTHIKPFAEFQIGTKWIFIITLFAVKLSLFSYFLTISDKPKIMLKITLAEKHFLSLSLHLHHVVV